MGNYRFIYRLSAPIWLAACLAILSCADEWNGAPTGEEQILFAADVRNSWMTPTKTIRGAEVWAEAEAMQSDSPTPVYLHTLYTDSIVPRTEDALNGASVKRAIPVGRNNMYDTFGVSAYATTGEWSNTTPTTYMYDVPVALSGSAWLPSETHYWPGEAYRMKFFAYAPKGNNAYRLSGPAACPPSISGSIPSDVADQKDLLVAASGEVGGALNSAVPLTFRHALTAVRFVCGDDMRPGRLKSVALKGVYSTGTYNMETEKWSAVGTTKDFSQTLDLAVDGRPSVAITTAPQTFMMIPQTLPDGAAVEVVWSDGSQDFVLTADIARSTWAMGKTVTYKISSSSINWEYTLAVAPPDDFTYAGGTDTCQVTSYRTNGLGQSEPVAWTATFSTDNGATWSAQRPSWLAAFANAGNGGTAANMFNATVSPQTGVTDNPHTRALRQRAAKGSAALPYNLANTAGGPTVENTANCYVVDAPGTYSLPLVYGNAIRGGAANTAAYTSTATGATILPAFINHRGAAITDPYIALNAGCTPSKAELVWQDAPALLSAIEYHNGTDGGYISFRVDDKTIRQGNALVAIKDAQGNILWSWHIWVTDRNIAQTVEVSNLTQEKNSFMPYALGWCDGDDTNYAERTCKVRFTAGGLTREITIRQKAETLSSPGNHPYYQWGRKDPLMPSTGTGGNNKVLYGEDGSTAIESEPLQNLGSGDACIRNCILNPGTMNSTPGMDYKYNNLWSANNPGEAAGKVPIVKTVYDPSPAGFRLSPTNAYTGFTKTGVAVNSTSLINGVWDNQRKGWLFYADASKAQTIFFAASGWRYYVDGRVDPRNFSGFYWTAEVNALNRNGNTLSFNPSRVNPLVDYNRSHGFGVRPVRE